MNEKIAAYIAELNQQFKTGNAREHAYRPALKALIEALLPGSYTFINEPSHLGCNAPDFMLMHKEVSVAFAEAKDLGDTDLDGTGKNREQFSRYKQSLNSLFFTDYLSFHFYAEGEKQLVVTIAKIEGNTIVSTGIDEQHFIDAVRMWASAKPQLITTPKRLAERMATKARLLADTIEKTLSEDTEKKSSLHHKLDAFRDVLIKDLDEHKFADLYAQTIAYGLFAARIHDKKSEAFTRTTAAELIPKTNPFLRQVFQQIAGFDIEESIQWIVDDLVAIFAATDVNKLRKSMSREQQRRDPMIHFYEDFLQAYDPAAKKHSGVYYTPQPVVEFIVRAVDDILKNDFDLPAGLADISKTEVPYSEMEDGKDTPTVSMKTMHRVQVLDPATGTGTFLAEVVNRIKETQQKGAWASYVDEHLIPRMYGFELMMAPYTIAHLKLDMLINWWDDEALNAHHKERLQIYLTNSLDQTKLVNKKLLAEMIANEANEANSIKHNAPVMVMIGNPPYSVSSSNKSPWITKLIEDYKKNLNERNIQPLSDDYIKFIRLGQYYIERTGDGVLAYISNNSFLDGLIHRQMRRELMRCFDDIYILDLHGNNRKKETAPDGSKDENVFSIMQGVSINIFVKNPNSENTPARIHHYDLYGTRKEKYAFLIDNSLSSINWKILNPKEPNLFFVPKDFSLQEEYNEGFKVDELMKQGVCGIQTGRDNLYIDIDYLDLQNRIRRLLSGDIDNQFIERYKVQDSSGYNMLKRIKQHAYNPHHIRKELYRPFDNRSIYYAPNLIKRSFFGVMSQMHKGNIGLITSRQLSTFNYQHVLCTDMMTDMCSISAQTKECSYLFPLYKYDEGSIESECIPNLDEIIWRRIENWVQFGQANKPLTTNEQNGLLGFDAEPEQPHMLAPEDIFDYIYCVLHSPAYRAKYKEFLKVDFPRIPYPKNAKEFEHFRTYGHMLRELHLMHNIPESYVLFPESGNMIVEQATWEDKRVQINATQYFDHVPKTAWEMYIGGYQPAQKWLKDRRGRTLRWEDVEHYRKIIFILSETARLMQEIDEV